MDNATNVARIRMVMKGGTSQTLPFYFIKIAEASSD